MKGRMFDALVPLLFTFLSILFFRPYVFGGETPLPFNLLVSFYSPWKFESMYGPSIPNKPLGDDNIKLFYPYRAFTTRELRAGRIPLWNPYTFSGSVNHAMYQSAVFYPLNLLYLVLPIAQAWSLIVMATPVLTGWYMYLFVRSLRIGRGPSLFGALVFALSGWMISFWEEVIVKGHTILWLPLALYGVNRMWSDRHKTKGILFFVFALVNALLAGFPQMIVYVFITVCLWCLYVYLSHWQPDRTRMFRLTVLCIVFAILITSFQWIPAFEAFLQAPRGKLDTFHLFEAYLTPLIHLVTLFAPDFWGNPGVYNNFSPTIYLQEHSIFIGIPGLLFALFALVLKNVPLFWKVFALVTLSMGFALPTSWVLYKLKIPVLNIAMPVRIFVLSAFGLSVLASYGIHEYSRKKYQNKIQLPVVLVAGLCVVLWLFIIFMMYFARQPYIAQLSPNVQKLISGYATISARNLVLPSVLLVLTSVGLLVFRTKAAYAWIYMGIVTVLSSMYFASKILYFSSPLYQYPIVEPIRKLQELAVYDRIWSYGDGYIVRNIPSYFGLYSPEGYEALYLHRYGSFLHTAATGGIVSDRIHRTDATLSETGQFEILSDNPVRLRLMSLAGVKFVLEHKDTRADTMIPPQIRFAPQYFNLSWENDRWRIWEYKNSLPRVFLATKTIVEEQPQRIIDRLMDKTLDIHSTVVVEDQRASLAGQKEQGTAYIVEYLPNSVKVRIDAKASSLLYLSDSFYSGWRAFVDNMETPIYRANFVFRAVPVPRGEHTVYFVYDPLSWRAGLYISLGTMIVFLLWIKRLS